MRRAVKKPDMGDCSATLGIASRTDAGVVYQDLPAEVRQLDVIVSPAAAYYRGDSLRAILWALGKAGLDQVTFVVAGDLQRHTHMMEQLPFMRELEQGLALCRNKEAALAFLQRQVRNRTIKGVVEGAIAQLDVWDASNLAPVFKAYRGAMTKFCNEKAKKAGASWVVEASDVILGKSGNPAFIAFPGFNDTALMQPVGSSDSASASELIIRHIDWETAASGSEYDAKFALVEDAYVTDSHGLQKVLDRVATRFAEEIVHRSKSGYPKRGTEGYDDLRREAIALSLKYLKEESAVFLQRMDGPDSAQGMAYPFHTEEVQKTGLFDCLLALRELTQETRMAMKAAGKAEGEPLLPVDIRITGPQKQQRQGREKRISGDATAAAADVVHIKMQSLALSLQIAQMPGLGADRKADLIEQALALVGLPASAIELPGIREEGTGPAHERVEEGKQPGGSLTFFAKATGKPPGDGTAANGDIVDTPGADDDSRLQLTI